MVSFVGNWDLLVEDYIRLFSKEVLNKKCFNRLTKNISKDGWPILNINGLLKERLSEEMPYPQLMRGKDTMSNYEKNTY